MVVTCKAKKIFVEKKRVKRERGAVAQTCDDRSPRRAVRHQKDMPPLSLYRDLPPELKARVGGFVSDDLPSYG
eukprot:6214825-Pleurochrysis_carterae.AAC.1